MRFLLTILFCLLAVPSWGQSWGVPRIGTVVEDATGNFTMTEPASSAAGDLMIACVGWRSNAAVTPPAGWSVVATQQNSGDTDATNGIASGTMWYLIRGGSAPDLVGVRTAGDVLQAQIVSYTGALATPFDAGTANTLAVASATNTTATITTAQAGELVVACSSAGDNLTASAFDATDPATASGATDTTTAPATGIWKERFDVGTGTGADHGLAFADAIRATAGATGTIQVTISAIAQHVLIAATFKPIWAHVQSTQPASATATTHACTVASNVTQNNLMVVGYEVGTAGLSPTCSDSDGNTWAVADTRSNATGGFTDIISYAVMTAATSSVTITCATNGGSLFARLACAEYIGLATTSPLNVAIGATGNSTNPTSGNLTTTAANTLVVGWGFTLTAITPGTGFTQQQNVDSLASFEDKLGTAAGTHACTFTAGSAQWAAQCAAFTPPAAAASFPAAMINNPQTY